MFTCKRYDEADASVICEDVGVDSVENELLGIHTVLCSCWRDCVLGQVKECVEKPCTDHDNRSNQRYHQTECARALSRQRSIIR
jgi:hypothetical protein